MKDTRHPARTASTCAHRRTPVYRKRVASWLGFLCLLFSGAFSSLHAGEPWDGGGIDNNWTTASNWVSDVVPANDGTVDVFFSGSTRLNPYADTNWLLRQIVFDSSAGAFTVSGSLLTIGSKGIENRDADTQTINNNLTLNAAQGWVADSGDLVLGGAVSLGSYALTFEGAYDTTASGAISGSGSIVKVDAGTLSLSGANTFSGGLDLTAGTLEIGHNTALGTGGFTVSAGTTLLAINGSRTVTNALSLGSGLTIGGSEDLTFSGNATMTANLTLTVDNTADTVFSGAVTGGNVLDKQGSGRLVLSGANVINGGSILAGTLNIQHDEALGVSKNYTISSGAALELQGGIDIDAKTTIYGSGISNGGALRNISGDNAVTAAVVNLGSAATIGSDSGTLTFNDQIDNKGFDLTITGAGNVTANSNIKSGGGLIKNGSGTLTLAGVTAFTGDLTLNDGTLLLGGNDRIADAVDAIFAGGTFDTAGYDETVGTLTLTADSIIDLGDADSVLHFADSSGVSWTGGATLTITNWSGDMSGGGTDQIYFGSSSSDLTAGQVAQVRFHVSGVYRDATILGSGELVPTPEPATWAGILGVVGLVSWRERKPLVSLWRRCIPR